MANRRLLQLAQVFPPFSACRAFSRHCGEIGAPDPVSNIRPIRFKGGEEEEEVRRLQVRLWELNHSFWKQHNTQFQEEKEKFVAGILSERIRQGHDADATKLTANELSLFYKHFLDSKFREHMQYNRKWLKLQALLTWSLLKQKLSGH